MSTEPGEQSEDCELSLEQHRRSVFEAPLTKQRRYVVLSCVCVFACVCVCVCVYISLCGIIKRFRDGMILLSRPLFKYLTLWLLAFTL